MSYLSSFLLSRLILSDQRPAPEELLEQANLQQLYADLRRRKAPGHDFYCTHEAVERFDNSQIEKTDVDRMEAMQQKIVRHPESAREYLDELLAFSEKYPDIPKTFNYICAAYRTLKQDDNFLAVAHSTIKKFPDYLFGKLSLCEYYLDTKQYNEIPKVLQHKMSLQQHYPRDVREFHISEVRSFHHVIGGYYAETDDITLAMSAWLILKDVAPGHITTKSLSHRIMLAEFRALKRKMKDGLATLSATSDLDLQQDLQEDLKANLPFFVQPKKTLIHSLKGDGVKLKSTDRLKVKDIVDLSDGGGIACAIHSPRKNVMTVASLTHLKFDRKHPLYKRVYEYQQLRTARLQQEQGYG